MKRNIIIASLCFYCLSLAMLRAEDAPVSQVPNETTAQRDARMAWWREAKFGLFIHWGVFSVPAGVTTENKHLKAPFSSEWLMRSCRNSRWRSIGSLRQAVQSGQIQRGGLGEGGQRRRHEIHRDHHEASRRLCDVRHQGQRLEHRAGAPLTARTRLKSLPRPAVNTASSSASITRRRRIGSTAALSVSAAWAQCRRWDAAMKTNMDEYIDKIAVPQVKEICSHYGEFPEVHLVGHSA